MYILIHTYMCTYIYIHSRRKVEKERVGTGKGAQRKVQSSVVRRKPMDPLFDTVPFPCSRK